MGGSAAKVVPIYDARAWVNVPNTKAAADAARKGFILDPETGKPYKRWGLFAPLRSFLVLGDDVHAYARQLHEGLVVAVVVTGVALPTLFYNFAFSADYQMILWQRLSIGGRCPSGWTPVITDAVYTIVFLLYIMWWQRYLVHDVTHQTAAKFPPTVFETALESTCHPAHSSLHPVHQSRHSPSKNNAMGNAWTSSSRPEQAMDLATATAFKEADYAIACCSVVSYGWKVEEGPPLAELDDLAGKGHIGVTRPTACSKLIGLRKKYDSLLLKRPWYAGREAAQRAAEAQGKRRQRTCREACIEWFDRLGGGAASLHDCDVMLRTLDAQIRNEERQARKLPMAFVTFPNSRAVSQLMTKAAAPGSTLKVNLMPNSSDIRWEWLELTDFQRKLRRWRSRCILLPCVVLSALGVSLAGYWQGAFQAGPPWVAADGSVRGFLVNLGNFLWTLGMVILSVQGILQPCLQLALNYDGAPTFTAMDLDLFIRMLVWQLGLVFTSGLLFINDAPWQMTFFSDNPLYASWFAGGGTAITMGLLGDALFINLVVDGINLPAVIQRCAARWTSPTQEILDEAWRIFMPIYMPLRWELQMKSWIVCLLLGSMMPILYVMHLIMLGGSCVVDRVNLLCRFHPLPSTQATIARIAAEVMLPAAFVGHVVIGTLVYSWIYARDAGLFEPGTMGFRGTLQGMFIGGPCLFYFIFSWIVVIVLGVFMVLQYRVSQRIGVMSAWKLLRLALGTLSATNNLFHLETASSSADRREKMVTLVRDDSPPSIVGPWFYVQPGGPPPPLFDPSVEGQQFRRQDLTDEDLKALFKKLDVNGSGYIQPMELLNHLMRRGHTAADAMGMYRAVATDCNGNISFKEFCTLLRNEEMSEEPSPNQRTLDVVISDE